MISKVNRYVLALGLSTAFIAPSLRAQTPAALADSDFVVAGIAPYMHPEAVEHVLGHPDSASVGYHPDLYYPGLNVSFAGLGLWVMTLAPPRYHTARGLRVGASLVRAGAASGPSAAI